MGHHVTVPDHTDELSFFFFFELSSLRYLLAYPPYMLDTQ